MSTRRDRSDGGLYGPGIGSVIIGTASHCGSEERWRVTSLLALVSEVPWLLLKPTSVLHEEHRYTAVMSAFARTEA